MKFAVVEDDKVANIVISESLFKPNWYEVSDEVGIGWSHLGGGMFSGPPQDIISRRDVIIARLAAIDATSDKPRTRRELAIDRAGTKAWLQTLDIEASNLRAELAGLQ